jgi:multimeric flavodoxin WrbA
MTGILPDFPRPQFYSTRSVTMNITVLNGSPKGEQSVTMQYVAFLQKKFPQQNLKIHHISQHLKKLERNDQAFQEIIDEVRKSDAVLWAFPLYLLLVHGNYKRFIELIRERHAQEAFRDKYAAALSTSIKFYDHTAHNYIHAICDDLNMRYIDYYSAAMRDLLDKKERQRLLVFGERFFSTIEKGLPTFRQYEPVVWQPVAYEPTHGNKSLNGGSKRIVIVADELDGNTNLGRMISKFQSVINGDVEIIDLSALNIKGGCLGCLQCGYDNTCTYEGKDGFIDMYNNRLKTADVLVLAGTIRDRYLSARWKTFFDRSFFNTHMPSLTNKQWGYLISGPLRQNENLREILQSWTEIQQSNLVGIVTDEEDDSAIIDGHIQHLAEDLLWCAEHDYIRPETFRRTGGMKIFRDEIWSHLRAVFQADHRYYKAHGFYDFPQKEFKVRLLNAGVHLLFKIPAVRRRFYTKELKPGMIRTLEKVVEKV